jgi:hypothetical protein
VPVSGEFSAPVVSTALSNFPTGPFTRSTVEQQYNFTANGSLQDLAAGGALIAFQETRAGSQGELVLRQLGGTASFPLANSQTTFANPNMAASNPEIVVFDQRSVSGGVGAGDIAFGDDVDLRRQGRRPRRHDLPRRGFRVAVLQAHPRCAEHQREWVDQPAADGGSGIGIIVQRILGTNRVLGRQAYRLGPARRVPLGTFKKGRHGIRWDVKVNGRKLAPGRYLVTVRAVTPKVVVRELGRPRVIRVR